MPDYPDFLEPGRHREARGRGHQPWIRRAFLGGFVVLLGLALLDVFGQRAETTRAAGSGAGLEVHGPTRVRGGLLFQERITVRATTDIRHPRLVLAAGWRDGLQINTIEPGAQSESTRDGRLVLSYGELKAGDSLDVYFQYQTDPTHVGTTDQSVEIDDETRPLASLSRSLTTFP